MTDTDEHFPEDYKNPITGLTRAETDSKFKPLYDGFVTTIQNALNSEKYAELNIAEGLDQASGPALMKLLKEEIPQCCSGHTFESLMEIVNMFALTNMVCKSSGCPEDVNHDFIDFVVEEFGKLGESMETKLVKTD